MAAAELGELEYEVNVSLTCLVGGRDVDQWQIGGCGISASDHGEEKWSESLFILVAALLDVNLESAEVREVGVDVADILGKAVEGMTIAVIQAPSVGKDGEVLQ